MNTKNFDFLEKTENQRNNDYEMRNSLPKAKEGMYNTMQGFNNKTTMNSPRANLRATYN